jgi:hypothetical protein
MMDFGEIRSALHDNRRGEEDPLSGMSIPYEMHIEAIPYLLASLEDERLARLLRWSRKRKAGTLRDYTSETAILYPSRDDWRISLCGLPLTRAEDYSLLEVQVSWGCAKIREHLDCWKEWCENQHWQINPVFEVEFADLLEVALNQVERYLAGEVTKELLEGLEGKLLPVSKVVWDNSIEVDTFSQENCERQAARNLFNSVSRVLSLSKHSASATQSKLVSATIWRKRKGICDSPKVQTTHSWPADDKERKELTQTMTLDFMIAVARDLKTGLSG